MYKIENKTRMHNEKQMGFTLIEIAIVLVIIGLLLGGILKGQELINSARVRSLADQNSGIQAAYFGFIDRFRQIPGDMDLTKAAQAIGETIFNGGDGNGRVDDEVQEAIAVWEQLARARFLGGGFTPATSLINSTVGYRDNAPINAFNGNLVLTRNNGYTGTGPVVRLNLHMGRSVPVNIARELDVKIDDSLPNTGILRLSVATTTGGGPFNDDSYYNPTFSECTTTANATDGSAPGTNTTTDIYDIFDNAQDCGQVFVY